MKSKPSSQLVEVNMFWLHGYSKNYEKNNYFYYILRLCKICEDSITVDYLQLLFLHTDISLSMYYALKSNKITFVHYTCVSNPSFMILTTSGKYIFG